jgi:hypothetical protein
MPPSLPRDSHGGPEHPAVCENDPWLWEKASKKKLRPGRPPHLKSGNRVGLPAGFC